MIPVVFPVEYARKMGLFLRWAVRMAASECTMSHRLKRMHELSRVNHSAESILEQWHSYRTGALFL